MKYQIQIIALLVGLAMVGGAYAYGYHRGSIAELAKIAEKTAETQQELFDLGDVIRIQTQELRRLQREKENLNAQLEQEAIVAPGSDNPGVATTGGLQRLERRWGPNPRTSN